MKSEKSPNINNSRIYNFLEFKETKHFVGLDGIRGLAVIGTIFAHAPNLELWTMLNGQNGVTAFFILSGFLITTLALREEEKYGNLNFRAFLIRRGFRLFPAYYLILGIYCILILGLNLKTGTSPSEFKNSLRYFVFYLQEYGHHSSYYQTWSLGIEEKFYLIWPIIAFGPFRKLQFRWVWAFTTASCLILSISLFWKLIAPLPYLSILMGSLTAVLLNFEPTYKLFTNFLIRFSFPCIFFMILCHFGSVYFPSLYLGSTISMATVLVILVVGGMPKTVSFLESNSLVKFGKYSYFIYLIHLLAKGFILKFQPLSDNLRIDSFVTIILTTILSYICAVLSYRYFEQPLISLGRKISDRYRGSPKIHSYN